jgi:UDP-N-acetylmuramoyl-L-alanyl-D-glutamate--2,6-diaminopimelate ligase
VNFPPAIGLTLGELCSALRDFEPVLSGSADVTVLDVDQDSRSIGPGALFAARHGGKTDGLRYAEDAARRGAVGVMADADAAVPALPCPVLRVRDVARALPFAAEAVHGHPSRALELVGVTGTNGKTTTTWLVQRALEELGVRCARLGTLGFEVAGQHDETHLTTPEADAISRSLALTRRLGGTHAVMEVSSVALTTHRVEALRFDVAAFSNLTHDHLDFHGTFEAYRLAKTRLFQALAPRAAVLNQDDEFGRWLAQNIPAPVVRVGMSLDCDVSGSGLRALPTGVEGQILVHGRPIEIRTRFVGRHNAENLLLALGILVTLGVDAERAGAALAHVESVPGRLERCDGPDDDCIVLVDYAHTPDALERVLAALAPASPSGRVICVFGCGGERDPKKRLPMGRAAGSGAGFAILTNDNPRGESPEAIAKAAEEGLRAVDARYEVILDRARAIERAVSLAAPGDVVLIAGKGHETYQLIGGVTLPFDDRREAKLALERRRAARRQGSVPPGPGGAERSGVPG